ncbi:hypothetical protein D3C87_1820260 [compost metagenome]
MAVGATEGEPRAAEQTLQRLLGTHLPADGRGRDAVGRLIGVDHADAGDPAEIAQGLGQWFGGQRKAELGTLLVGASLSRQRDAQRQQRQRRKAQGRHLQPLFDQTRFCPGLHCS